MLGAEEGWALGTTALTPSIPLSRRERGQRQRLGRMVCLLLRKTQPMRPLRKATAPSPPASPTPSEWVPAAGRGDNGNGNGVGQPFDKLGQEKAGAT